MVIENFMQHDVYVNKLQSAKLLAGPFRFCFIFKYDTTLYVK